MKFKITLVGIITLIVGVLPLLDDYGIIESPIPTEGLAYAGIIIVIGVIDLVYSAMATVELLGTQHLVVMIIAVLTILVGVAPLISASLPPSVPTEGIAYHATIAAVGALGTVYGISQLRY